MLDHDQRFKVLLKESLVELSALFFPQWATLLDPEQAEWLDKEAFVDPPTGETRLLDLVAKLPVKGRLPPLHADMEDPSHALLHVEIEYRDSVEPLRRRMYDYNKHLHDAHQLPTLSVGLYVNVGLEGIGTDRYERSFQDLQRLTFEYPYVGLPAMNGEDHLRGDNWLGVALSMRMRLPADRRSELACEALNRLVECPLNDWKRHLLCEFVCTYGLPTEEERQRFLDELKTRASERARAMAERIVTVWEQHGRELGREEGRHEGRAERLREDVAIILEDKFGPLSSDVLDGLRRYSDARLEQLLRAAAKASSLRELNLESTADSNGEQS